MRPSPMNPMTGLVPAVPIVVIISNCLFEGYGPLGSLEPAAPIPKALFATLAATRAAPHSKEHREIPSINIDNLPGDVVRRGRGQEDGCACKLA